MTAQRNFSSAPHTNTIDRSDYRLVAGLECADQVVQRRRLHRHRLAKFTNVGSAGQHAVGTGDNDGQYAIVHDRPLHRCLHRLPGRQTHAIDGRIINGDDGDTVLDLVAGGHLIFSDVN